MNGVGWGGGGGAMESSLVVNIVVNHGEKVALSGLCGILGIWEVILKKCCSSFYQPSGCLLQQLIKTCCNFDPA